MDAELIKTICVVIGAVVPIVGGMMAVINRMENRLEKKIDFVYTELKAEIGSVRTDLTKKTDSLHTELKAEIADVKSELNLRMDRLDGRMDRLENRMERIEGGQKELVKEMALMKNNESKLNFKMARWMFAKSIGKEPEEVDSLLVE
jgi:chromosome segregation ATPase